MSSVQVRSPTAKVSFGPEALVASGFTLTNFLNIPPSCVVDTQFQSDVRKEATEIDWGKVRKYMSDMDKYLNGTIRTAPDSAITIFDGVTKIKFSGIFSGVERQDGWGMTGMSHTFVNKYALLAGVDLSIYDNPYKWGLTNRDETNLGSMYLDRAAAPIPQKLREIFRKMTKNPNFLQSLTDADQAIKEGIHGGNIPLFPMLNEFIGAMERSHVDMFNIGTLDQRLQRKITYVIHESILQARNFMSGLLDGINTQFHTFVGFSTQDSNEIIFRHELELFDSQATNITVPKESLVYHIGSNITNPVTQVVIQAVGEGIYGSKNKSQEAFYRPLSVFPETSKPGGKVLRVDGPAWGTHPEITALTSVAGKALISDFRNTRQSLRKVIGKITDSNVRSVMEKWARVNWVRVRYGPVKATITVPLDLRFKPGEKHNVYDKAGKFMFTGILEGVIHEVSKLQSQDGSMCKTVLKYSHVSGVQGGGSDNTTRGISNTPGGIGNDPGGIGNDPTGIGNDPGGIGNT